MYHCNNGLSNKVVESLVENKVAQETGDLKYLQDSMREFVNTLKEIILGEYAPEFFNTYFEEATKEFGGSLEEFLQVPSSAKEIKEFNTDLLNYAKTLEDRIEVLESKLN